MKLLNTSKSIPVYRMVAERRIKIHLEGHRYGTCKICFWEDDPVQLNDESFQGGANRVFLLQARKNFLQFGACEKEMITHARKPKEDELKGID